MSDPRDDRSRPPRVRGRGRGRRRHHDPEAERRLRHPGQLGRAARPPRLRGPGPERDGLVPREHGRRADRDRRPVPGQPGRGEGGARRGRPRSSASPRSTPPHLFRGPEGLRGALRQQGRRRRLHRDAALLPPGPPRGRARRGQARLPREAGGGGRAGLQEGDGARRAGDGRRSSASRSASRSATPRPTSSSRSGSTRARSARPSRGRSTTSPRRINRPDWPTRRPAERRLRNWVHDKALSGDIIVEQNVHIIDVTNWLLKGAPGEGGRLRRPRRPHRPGRRLEPLQLRLHLPGRRPHQLRLHAVRHRGVGRRDAVLRHQGQRRGPLRRARPHLRRDPAGSSPGLGQARRRPTGGRGHRRLPRRPRRRRPEQAEGLHREHHERQPRSTRRSRAPSRRSPASSAAWRPTPARKSRGTR